MPDKKGRGEDKRDILAATRKVITQDLTVAEAIVIQTCISGYIPIIAASDDFPGKDSFLLVSGKILPPLMKRIEKELEIIEQEVSSETTPTLVYSKEQT